MGYFDAALIARDHLAHHGVKGQKWGVRRYQDKNGHRIGGKSSTSTSKSKKKVHEFEDHSKSDMSARNDAVKATLSAWGSTAISAAAIAGGVATGNGGLAVLGGMTGYFALPVTVISTAHLVGGDIQAAKANKKEKKFAEERAQNPIDKKTGFHKKTTEMTPEEDMERVNPAYKNWDANTKSNCVLCTMSYELRRRGYDVQANKATDGYDSTALTPDWFKGAKCKESEGSLTYDELNSMWHNNMVPTIDKARQAKMIDDTFATVEKQPEGARGQIAVTWNGTYSGHSMAYAKENGKLVIYDTQANEKLEGDKARELLKHCSQIDVTRLDNCEVNTKYIKEVAT